MRFTWPAKGALTVLLLLLALSGCSAPAGTDWGSLSYQTAQQTNQSYYDDLMNRTISSCHH